MIVKIKKKKLWSFFFKLLSKSVSGLLIKKKVTETLWIIV